MARCARSECGRWRPDSLVRRAHVGIHFDAAWFCSSECLARHTEDVLSAARTHVAGAPSSAQLRLGDVLVKQQAVTADIVALAVREQRQSGRRLGDQLLQMGLLSREELLRALAAQAGTGYLAQIDARHVEEGPGGLSAETIRVLGLVPFEVSRDGERLAVACVAPVPRASMQALREITGARVDAFVVADTEWQRLAAAYGTRRRPSEPKVATTTLRSIADAALRIAASAGQGGAERMQHACCEPFMWVRLEGQRYREDLLVRLGVDTTESDRWPVAPTSH